MSRVLATCTSSEQFHHIKIQIQQLSAVYPGLSCVIRQLATSAENLVASPQFLVALATSESQFQALVSRYMHLTKIGNPIVL